MRAETPVKQSSDKNSSPRSAHQKLREAPDAVAKASAIHGEGFSDEICGELVRVDSSPTYGMPRAPQGWLRNCGRDTAFSACMVDMCGCL
ncbi:hypothetical protein R8510_04989 [Ralstonia chuxiongensis]|nr:hypothetical protein R8510_04989 [Ralstonia chuxiongensis]